MIPQSNQRYDCQEIDQTIREAHLIWLVSSEYRLCAHPICSRAVEVSPSPANTPLTISTSTSIKNKITTWNEKEKRCKGGNKFEIEACNEPLLIFCFKCLFLRLSLSSMLLASFDWTLLAYSRWMEIFRMFVCCLSHKNRVREKRRRSLNNCSRVVI
jgi:hypothetical protein